MDIEALIKNVEVKKKLLADARLLENKARDTVQKAAGEVMAAEQALATFLQERHHYYADRTLSN